jgi:AcrR family transcriptional regulator
VSSERQALSLGNAPPLPRGRHRLSPAEVRSSQRARLLAAMLECVGEEGYPATTVPRVVARARVSRNAFYELFSDKLDCFLALCDELAEEFLAQIQPTGPTDWLTALRQGIRRYLEWWQERPAWSRTWLLEAPAAGPEARAQRERQYRRFQEMFDGLAQWARQSQPGLPPLWPRATQVIVHSVTDLVANEVAAGRLDRLVELEDDLVFLILTLLTDEATARRETGHG